MPALMRKFTQMPADMRQRMPRARIMRPGAMRMVSQFAARPVVTTAVRVPQTYEVQASLPPRTANALYGARGIYGLAGLSGPFDFVTDVVKSLIPEKTVAGKALRGDYKGAAEGATKFAVQTTSAVVNRRPQGVPGSGGGQPEYAEASPGVNINWPLVLGGVALGGGLIYLLVRRARA